MEHSLNQREQTLAQHLLLFLRGGSGQHTGSQGLLTLDQHRLLWGRGTTWSCHHGSLQNLGWRVASSGGVLEALLLGPAGLGSDLSWGEESLGLRHGGHEVPAHPHL